MAKIQNKNKQFHGFTILELLVVIVIIGILTTIVYVSYVGIQTKAHEVSVLSDLDTLDALEANYGLKNNLAGKAWYSGNGVDSDLNFTPSDGSVIDVVIDSSDYCIRGYHPQGTKNTIYNASTKESSSGACDRISPSYEAHDWKWAQANLNVGTMITGVTAQTDNSIIEKYCYNNLEANCTTYGGLYQRMEAMQYVTTEGAQGICPTGYHIPTDAQWKTLEMQLGMTQAQADATGMRGTDQGTQLKSGGTSGLNMLLSGYRYTPCTFLNLGSGGYFLSSTMTVN
jgi:uncharacterized protein (TIGR02145 family)/prepilin-type N-terminal cleavage/methylation domain-containing protein